LPFYDYVCTKCKKKTLDVFEKMNDDKLFHPCPDCSSEMKRMLSVPQVIYKDLPKGHNISATERRKIWNEKNPGEYDWKKIS